MSSLLLWRTLSSPRRKSPIAQSVRPSLFLKTLQAALRDEPGVSLSLFDSKSTHFSPEALMASFRRHPSTLIVIEAGLHGAEELRAFCDQISDSPGSVLILVGQGPSSAPEAFLQAAVSHPAVFIVAGEPEGVILAAIREHQTRGTLDHLRSHSFHRERKSFARHLFDGFGESPPLSFEASELRGYPYRFPLKTSHPLVWGHAWATRGCPHACTFCTHLIRETYGKTLRTRSLDLLREELGSLKGLGVNALAFADDDLTASREYLEALCQMMIDASFGFRWTAHARVDECDPALLRRMRSSGCSLLRFGVETGSPRILRYYNKTREPDHWWRKAREVVRECRRLDIQASGLFILGAPGETLADLLRTLYRILFTGFDLVQIHLYTPYPDTVEGRRTGATGIDYSHYSLASRNFSAASSFSLKLVYVLGYLLFYLNPWQVLRILRNYSGFIFHHFGSFMTSNLGLLRLSLSALSPRKP